MTLERLCMTRIKIVLIPISHFQRLTSEVNYAFLSACSHMANTPYTLKAWQVAQRDLHLEAVHFIPRILSKHYIVNFCIIFNLSLIIVYFVVNLLLQLHLAIPV